MIFEDDVGAYFVCHDCFLVVVVHRVIDYFFNVFSGAVDAHGNHFFREEFAIRAYPLPFCGFENGESACDFSNVGVPCVVVVYWIVFAGV